MNSLVNHLSDLASEVSNFPIWKCGPSDDPDKQYAFATEFREIATRFVGALRRLNNPKLLEMLREINENIDTNRIVDAHELRSRLLPIIDYISDILKNPEFDEILTNRYFVDPSVLKTLKEIKYKDVDLRKLIRLVEELNDSFYRGNYLGTIFIIRAIINHIPPIFGVDTFAQVVAQAGRSTKAILMRLEDSARSIADLHSHQLIRRKETLPSINQIEPYKAPLEVLLQEIIAGAEE